MHKWLRDRGQGKVLLALANEFRDRVGFRLNVVGEARLFPRSQTSRIPVLNASRMRCSDLIERIITIQQCFGVASLLLDRLMPMRL